MPARGRDRRRGASCSRRNDGPGGGSRSGTAGRIAAWPSRRSGGRPASRGAAVSRRLGPRTSSRLGRVSGGAASGASAAALVVGARRLVLGLGIGRRLAGDWRRRAAASTASTEPSLGGRFGQERIGLGLEVGDLGLELEAEHLASDLVVGRRERACFGRRRRPRGVFATEPRQEPVPRPATGVFARTMAAASIAVRPGSDMSHTASRQGGAAGRTRRRLAGERGGAPRADAVVGRSPGQCVSSTMARMLPRGIRASEYPIGPGSSTDRIASTDPPYSHSMVAGGLELMS